MRRTKEAVFIGIITNFWNIYLESVALFENYDRLFMIFQLYYVINSLVSGFLMMAGLMRTNSRVNLVFVGYLLVIS